MEALAAESVFPRCHITNANVRFERILSPEKGRKQSIYIDMVA